MNWVVDGIRIVSHFVRGSRGLKRIALPRKWVIGNEVLVSADRHLSRYIPAR